MAEIIPIERIENRIFIIRGQKVMLDRDLAGLYGVKTKTLNQSVKRNTKRFPDDFVFQVSLEEKNELVTNCDRFHSWKHSASLPYAFTDNGVAMLSGVLKSGRAVLVNVQIMRTFTRLRTLQESQKHVLNQLNKHEIKLLQHDHKFAEVFQVLDDMRQTPDTPKKKKIGFAPVE
jgi:hypothetical protein